MPLKISFSRPYILNLVTTFLSQACSAGLIILLIPVLNERFSIEEFSNYGVLLNIVLFTSAFDLGLNLGLMRRLIQEPLRASVLISSSFFFYLLLFLIAFPIFLWLYHSQFLASGDHFFSYALLTSLLVLQTVVAAMFDVILQSANKIFIGKLIRIGKTIIEFGVLYYFSKEGSAVLLLTASSVVNFLFICTLFFFSKKETSYHLSIAKFSWLVLSDHIRYSFWYFLNSIGVVFVFNSQIILLNHVTTKAEVASYIMVSRFLDVVRMGATNFTVILFPTLAQQEVMGEWQQLRITYFKVLRGVFLLCILMLCFLLTIGKFIFEYWSGLSGQSIEQLYTLFSVFTILIVLDNVSSVFLHALRLNKMQTIISIGQGIFALVLGYFLLQTMGIIGFIVASLIALLFTNFIYNPYYLITQFRRKIG